jgi:hypothetical protein
MEAACTSEKSVDIDLRTWQYIPEYSELQLVDFHEIRQAGHAIEGDLNTIISNNIGSTILKLLRF